MNILYVSSKTGWGGIMGWMVRTAEDLERKGHNVFIWSNPKSKLIAANYPALRITEQSLGPDYNYITMLKLIRFIKINKIGLIISNIRKEVWMSGKAARYCGIAHLRRIGAADDLNMKNKKVHKSLVDHSIIPCHNIFDKAISMQNWFKKEDFSVIYNGRNVVNNRDQKHQENRDRWSCSHDDIVIGTTVRLSPLKNVEGIINAFSELIMNIPKIKLVISGFGQEEENLRRSVTQKKLTERVIFNGFINNPVDTACGYDIAVLNSLDEGFPNTLVEYMAAGCACVVTNVGGASEIAQHLENALMISPSSDDQLKAALSSLAKDEALRDRLGQKARETVQQRFSRDMMIDQLEKLFQRFYVCLS